MQTQQPVPTVMHCKGAPCLLSTHNRDNHTYTKYARRCDTHKTPRAACAVGRGGGGLPRHKLPAILWRNPETLASRYKISYRIHTTEKLLQTHAKQVEPAWQSMYTMSSTGTSEIRSGVCYIILPVLLTSTIYII